MRFVVSSFALALTVAATAAPREERKQQHEGHRPGGGGDAKAWRMPPHDFPMPPLPGMDRALPIVGPFLAAMDVTDPSVFPEAEPGAIVEMEDGETLELRASIVRRTLNGKTVLMYGYNGQYPGPLIKAKRGSTVIVEFKNEIEMPTTVHWHGLRLDNRFDGVPDVTQAPVLPGESFRYEVYFPDTGIYWYHPHMREDIQQDLGLYGNLLVAPPEPDYYSPVNREEALILDDILMDDLGLIPWGDRAPTHALMGRFGNVMLVNGVTDYALRVAKGEVVRFYLTNVANTRTFNVVFGGAPIKIVASDVSKYQREVWVESVVIGSAERYVVEVLFAEPGEVEITNSIQAIDDFMGRFHPRVEVLGRVVVSEDSVSESHAEAFRTLRVNADVGRDIEAYRRHFDRAPDHELELTLDIENLPIPIVRAVRGGALCSAHRMERRHARNELALERRAGALDVEGPCDRQGEHGHRLAVREGRRRQDSDLQRSRDHPSDEPPVPHARAALSRARARWRSHGEPRLERHHHYPRGLDGRPPRRYVESG